MSAQGPEHWRPEQWRPEQWRPALRWLLAIAFLVTGVAHLQWPAPFLRITPDWVPYPKAVIRITGLFEVAASLALLLPRLRRIAGALLAIYAVCVFPANVKHAFLHVAITSHALGWGYHAPRLAFQPVIVWWALFAGEVTSWPFADRFGRRTLR